MAAKPLNETTLYFRQGTSDKVYYAAIEGTDDACVVNFAYGRRGSTLTTGTKTKCPASLQEAQKVFQKLISEKQAKGYIPGDNTPSYTPPTNTPGTDIQCLLLTAVEEDAAVNELLDNQRYALQEKIDGKRILLTAEPGGSIIAYNRSGKPCGLSNDIASAARTLATKIGPFMLDGEAIGDRYFSFDMLDHEHSLRDFSFAERYLALRNALSNIPLSPALNLIETAFERSDKRFLLNRIREDNGEGVVFRPTTATYLPGRQPDHFKHKFIAEASVVVLGLNQKSSVSIGVFKNDEIVNVGNCTIRDDTFKLQEGDIIDVRYLYAFRGGALFQPRMTRKRTDIPQSSCTIEQLKFKNTVA